MYFMHTKLTLHMYLEGSLDNPWKLSGTEQGVNRAVVLQKVIPGEPRAARSIAPGHWKERWSAPG